MLLYISCHLLNPNQEQYSWIIIIKVKKEIKNKLKNSFNTSAYSYCWLFQFLPWNFISFHDSTIFWIFFSFPFSFIYSSIYTFIHFLPWKLMYSLVSPFTARTIRHLFLKYRLILECNVKTMLNSLIQPLRPSPPPTNPTERPPHTWQNMNVLVF